MQEISDKLFTQAEEILKEFYGVELLGDSKSTLEEIKIVEFALKKAAKITAKPWFKIAPGCIELDPESLDPVNPFITQKKMFSFINDLMQLRSLKILGE